MKPLKRWIYLELEHFLYGQLNGKGYGYTTIKSDGVDKILTTENFHHLCRLDGPAIIKSWVPNDKLVARSYLSYTLDEYMRRNIWNHTILIEILDYIQIQNFDEIDKHFIREDAKAPKKLEPLRINTK